jgi:hypothetical protein
MNREREICVNDGGAARVILIIFLIYIIGAGIAQSV